MYNLTEKREYKRIELENRRYKKIDTPCITKFCNHQNKEDKISDPDWNIVAVKNLSAGGMVFTYDRNLEIDSILNIKLQLSKSLPTISCAGRVVRSEEHQHLSRYFIAIMFTEISTQMRECINVTIENILRKKGERKSISFNKLVQMVNFRNRSKRGAEPLPEAIENREIKSADSEAATTTQRNFASNKVASPVAIKEESTRIVSYFSARLENQIGNTNDQTRPFSQSKTLHRVMFRLPKFAASEAVSVNIVGDFNNWDAQRNPMRKETNGDYTISLDLEPGNNYKFCYLIDSVMAGLSNVSIRRGATAEENRITSLPQEVLCPQ
ncbi:MAG: hypothetical protein GY941_27020 [Planctomycetes bacterium]|nr:hypothetical protein [Planctomycetota bacterium]